MRLRLLFFIALALRAQTSLTITSASLNIDPTATDSYTLQGTFQGLDFTTAQSVTLQVGPYSGTIPIGSFVQQGNLLTYQDSTGQTPYWVSSLTIDTNATTFVAQSTGIVLAGVADPFAVRLGTDKANGCSMARVQQMAVGAFQLTAGDGANEPCQIPNMPVAEPPVVPVGTATNVTITINLLPTPGLDPSTLQAFVADGNGQASGGPICTFSQNSGTTYSCTASFNQLAAGMIPLIVQAAAGPLTILSPGFSVQAAAPPADGDPQLMNIQNAMQQASQNFVQYGDSAYARILTIQSLRSLFQIPPGLTGQPVELSPDGLSIGVRSDSGLMIMDYLINDLQLPGTSASAMLAPRFQNHRASGFTRQRAPLQSTLAPAIPAAQQCGQFQRDIVQNDSVLLWDPGQLFFEGADHGPKIIPPLTASKCPPFASQLTQLSGTQATFAAIGTFPNYGTIIMATHGGIDSNSRSFIVTGQMSGTTTPNYAPGSQVGISCFSYGLPFYLGNIPIYPNWGCFFHVYASYITAQTGGLLSNSIIFAGLCYGASGDMAAAFTPIGSNNSYFAFDGVSNTGDGAVIGSSIFTSLVHQHAGTSQAYSAAPLPTGAPLLLYGDRNLAYLGNPRLNSPQLGSTLPLALGPGSVVDLMAQLDGASECGGIMNYTWTNTAAAGHLVSSTGGQQDNYTNVDPNATYTASRSAQSVDVITVQYFPDMADPPAAMACSATDVTTQQILDVVFDGSGTWDEIAFGNEFSADLSWHASWALTLSPGGVGLPGSGLSAGGFSPALPGTIVTGETIANAPNANDFCDGPPVVNPTHGGKTTALPQSPYLGIGPPSGTPTSVNMWVETFGGDDFSLCGTGGLATVGDYGQPAPGYPSWDTPAGIVMFTIDPTQWVNQPNHSMSMPVKFDILPISGGYDTGTGTHVTGTLTFTSRTVATPNQSNSTSVKRK